MNERTFSNDAIKQIAKCCSSKHICNMSTSKGDAVLADLKTLEVVHTCRNILDTVCFFGLLSAEPVGRYGRGRVSTKSR